ncbi:Pyruvate/Phosphoenolpyruvate kinase-like domain-containing protein [Fusarium oxysporum Fo47]|uniref:Pyruvate/Phosphoenolpyruvate kinase-like domain-containing protein n=1 Tax=Fusarium oxysporum Fo47 TaxID=660027 RepID=UPI002869B7E1|nr:Pyruvate/Phosphoenolpyruvate kinase-like domain-containing protein [Fusarium oxysporum Fo47]QKD59908.2 Pyruvate/Phosphoenolpyruvate kinase-like domain-containing protein [Fusarium oxysporum Fo47]
MGSGNFFKAALDKGAGPSLGYWQMMPSTNISRMLAQTPGCDWVLIDCEHGDLDDRDMRQCVPAVAAAGASPIILVPLLQTAQEARDIVKAAKFPPMGNRGFGSPFSMGRFKPVPTSDEYLQQANDSLLTLVQIETKSALDNLEEIAAVEGIDVLFIGPFDLGNSIGYPILNGVVKPELKAAINRILEVSRKAGKKCGIYSGSGEQAKGYIEAGFNMVHIGTDYAMLQQATRAEMGTARGRDLGKRHRSPMLDEPVLTPIHCILQIALPKTIHG